MDTASEAAPAAPPVVVFKRKRGPASNNAAAAASTSSSSSTSAAGPSRASLNTSNTTPHRRASTDGDSDGSEEASSAVVVKKKRSNNNPLVQSTGSVYRKSKPGTSTADDDIDDDAYILDHTPTASSSTATSSLQRIRDDATKHSNWDLDSSSSSATPAAAKPSNSDGLYRGASSYTSYIAARDDGTSSKMRSRGPIRQTTTVRTTSLMDYQPDICKDYKETGYCGFGDTCKFLHDRSDYLAGWQLDVLPNSTRNRENLLSDPEEEEEEEVPFACLICRQPFADPVVTQCGHYFCSACAVKRYAKNSKCFACGKQTGGLFNSARKVLDKMATAKRRKEEAREERQGWFEEEPVAEVGGESDDD